MNEDPRVSVLIPAHNAATTLRRAVDSILGQTLDGPIEVIVVNDGSTDGTRALVESFRDGRVRSLHLPATGIPGALNAGLAEARAPVIALQDSDDWSAPDRLEHQLAVLDASPEVAVVSGAMQEVDGDGRPLRPRATFRAGDQGPLLMRFNGVFHPFVAYRRDVVVGLGGYDRRYRFASDYDVWLRVSEHHRVVALDRVLGFHTMAGGGVSMRHERAQIGYSILMRLRAIRRRRDLRQLPWLVLPVLSWLTPAALKRAVRRRRGQPV